MKTFTLDGKTYELESLSEDAQKVARQTAMTAEFISKLEARLAIARTGQARYVEQLKTLIEGNKR